MSGNILTRMYRRIANGSLLWFIPGGALLQTGVVLSYFVSAWFLLESAIGAFILFAIVAGAISNARPSSLWERLAAAVQLTLTAVQLTLFILLGVWQAPWMIPALFTLVGVDAAGIIIGFIHDWNDKPSERI